LPARILVAGELSAERIDVAADRVGSVAGILGKDGGTDDRTTDEQKS
jgi:hypothetical protein